MYILITDLSDLPEEGCVVVSHRWHGFTDAIYLVIFQSSSVKKFSPKKSSIYAGILED